MPSTGGWREVLLTHLTPEETAAPGAELAADQPVLGYSQISASGPPNSTASPRRHAAWGPARAW